MSPKSTQQVS